MTSTFSARNSLKSRITFATLALFLVSIWSLLFYSNRILREDLQRLLGEQQYSTASVLASDINTELDDRLKALEQVATRITPPMLNDSRSIDAFLRDRPVLASMFSAGVFVTRADGALIAQIHAGEMDISSNFGDREVVIESLKGKSVIGTPVPGTTDGAPVFGVATPIRNGGGAVIGSLVGVIDLGQRNFLDKISRKHFSETGGYLLVDSKLRSIITSTDKSRIMELLPAPGNDATMDRFLGGFEGTSVIADQKGNDVLASAKQIPSTGWLVIATMPMRDAFAPIHHMQQRILFATVVLTLVAGSLTWILLRYQLSPMLNALQALAKLSSADAPLVPLSVTSNDEIGDLIRGFNRLLTILGQRDDEVRQLAFYDTLTGLPNRRLLNDRLKQAIAAAKRSGGYGAVLFLDLDNFKPLNDTHGHDSGDMVLIEAALRLKRCVRESDTVARFGGDEYIVILSELDGGEKEAAEQVSNPVSPSRSSILRTAHSPNKKGNPNPMPYQRMLTRPKTKAIGERWLFSITKTQD